MTLPPATLQGSLQLDLDSTFNGRRYRVRVAQPWIPPLAKGYPVLVVLDGDPFWAIFAEAMRLRSLAREIAPAGLLG